MKSNIRTEDLKFPELFSFLAGTYHQDVWYEFETHEAIWDDFLKYGGEGAVRQLIEEIGEALTLTPAELCLTMLPYMKSNGLSLAEEDVPKFLTQIKEYMEASRL